MIRVIGKQQHLSGNRTTKNDSFSPPIRSNTREEKKTHKKRGKQNKTKEKKQIISKCTSYADRQLDRNRVFKRKRNKRNETQFRNGLVVSV